MKIRYAEYELLQIKQQLKEQITAQFKNIDQCIPTNLKVIRQLMDDYNYCVALLKQHKIKKFAKIG